MCDFKRKLRVDHFQLYITLAGGDPADLAQKVADQLIENYKEDSTCYSLKSFDTKITSYKLSQKSILSKDYLINNLILKVFHVMIYKWNST